MKNLTLSLLLSTTPLFAGVEAPVMAPPAPDCEAGFTLSLEALYLKAYQSEGDYEDNDFEFGGRASIGYDFNNCFFVKATYFNYSADPNDQDLLYAPFRNNEYEYTTDLDLTYLDLVVGEHFKPSEKLTLSPYVGLRWATFEEDNQAAGTFGATPYQYSFGNDFSGLGIVVGIDATRALGGGFSIYGTAKQSVVFGDNDNENVLTGPNGPIGPDFSDDGDRVVFITELGLGAQYDFAFGSVTGNIRAGVEAQYWTGLSSTRPTTYPTDVSSSDDVGLAGFVLGANFKF